jgi:hypothetical protein
VRAVGKTPQAITHALNSGKDGGGQIPGIWEAILAALDLEPTAVPDEQKETSRQRHRLRWRHEFDCPPPRSDR